MSFNLLLQIDGVNTFRKESGAHVFFKRLFIASAELFLVFYSPHYLRAVTQSMIKHEISSFELIAEGTKQTVTHTISEKNYWDKAAQIEYE